MLFYLDCLLISYNHEITIAKKPSLVRAPKSAEFLSADSLIGLLISMIIKESKQITPIFYWPLITWIDFTTIFKLSYWPTAQ